MNSRWCCSFIRLRSVREIVVNDGGPPQSRTKIGVPQMLYERHHFERQNSYECVLKQAPFVYRESHDGFNGLKHILCRNIYASSSNLSRIRDIRLIVTKNVLSTQILQWKVYISSPLWHGTNTKTVLERSSLSNRDLVRRLSFLRMCGNQAKKQKSFWGLWLCCMSTSSALGKLSWVSSSALAIGGHSIKCQWENNHRTDDNDNKSPRSWPISETTSSKTEA